MSSDTSHPTVIKSSAITPLFDQVEAANENYFEFLFVDPRYHITGSETSNSVNASLTVTVPILTWWPSNERDKYS